MKRISLIILLAAITLSGMAQTIGEAFYIYRNDGKFNAFFRDEVQAIEYSYYDADSIKYEEIVTQVVITADSVYKIPLAAIDSVGFVQPETKYKDGVVKMEPLLPYIVSVDGLTVKLSSNMPAGLMPKEGDVLIQDNFDSEILPEGFAGRIIQCTGQQIICDSVSFEDIYEQIVCCGRFDAIDDDANKNMRFVPRRADFTTGIEINGIVGSKGSGIYCSAKGKLGLKLRICLKYSITQPPYFELSLTPELKLAFEVGVKGHLSSENILHNKYTLIGLPIPDTPFTFKVWGGEVLNCSVDASVTASTEASLGFKIGVKYEDGAFKGICQNTSKWFSMPNVTGNISGSIFGGIQFGYGICTYGNVVSLNLENEAGAEFVANLSEDLMNSNKYEELQKAHFDLNLKASTGISIYAKILKWVNVSEKWNLLSAQMNINSWKLVPTFQKPSVTVNDHKSADISVKPSEKLLFPVSIGIGVWDEGGNFFDAQYCSKTYRVFENWGLTQFQTSFTNLLPNQNYMVYPLVKLFGMEIKASPSETFMTKAFPVTLSDFEVTKSQYEEDGFTHGGVSYDYRFDVSVTATLDEDAEGIADWGYVYLNPNGNEAFISLKQFGYSYTDTRWAYFRNGTPPFTCTLYGYVKYVGNNEIVYGERHDYLLVEKEEDDLCPDENHPHWIDLGIGTLWSCCNVGASSPKDFGDYFAWGETQTKDEYSKETYLYENVDIGSDIAGTQYDAATVNWGAPWQMPTKAQFEKLIDSCSSVWTIHNGVEGRIFTGPSKASIFFPAAGYYWKSKIKGANRGRYHSSTWAEYGYDKTWAFCFVNEALNPDYERYVYMDSDDWRYGGLPVRPVYMEDKKNEE